MLIFSQTGVNLLRRQQVMSSILTRWVGHKTVLHFCLSKWKSCQVTVSFQCVCVCVCVCVETGWSWGFLHFLFFFRMCACFNVCFHLCANIREAWGVVLTLKIDGWSLRKKKRPIFYCTLYLCVCVYMDVCVCLREKKSIIKHRPPL